MFPFSDRAPVLKQGTCHFRRRRKDAIFSDRRRGGKRGLSCFLYTRRGRAVLPEDSGGAPCRAALGAEAGENSICAPKSPIEQGRLNVPPVGKEGDLMTPLHTMLLCLPAGLALLIDLLSASLLTPVASRNLLLYQ